MGKVKSIFKKAILFLKTQNERAALIEANMRRQRDEWLSLRYGHQLPRF